MSSTVDAEPRKEDRYSIVWARELRARMDAYYFNPRRLRASDSVQAASSDVRALSDVAEVHMPGIFKRRYAPDPSFGVPYLSGSEVFHVRPTSDRHLMRRVVADNKLLVTKGTILVQEAGGAGGSLAKSVFVGRTLDGFCCTNNMFRVRCVNLLDTAYLFAFLSSPTGVAVIERTAAGSLVQHIDPNRMRAVEVPWPSPHERTRIGERVLRAVELRDLAVEEERKAIAMVELAIEEAT